MLKTLVFGAVKMDLDPRDGACWLGTLGGLFRVFVNLPAPVRGKTGATAGIFGFASGAGSSMKT